MCVFCFCGVPQGIVIGTGENSEFGEVFKMMQAEEVRYSTFYLKMPTSCLILLFRRTCSISPGEFLLSNYSFYMFTYVHV